MKKNAPSSKRDAHFNPLGWIPLALVVWLAVFGSYEIAERTLLEGSNPNLIHLLHIIRGTGTSFLLAGVAAWYILRKRLPLQESQPAARPLRTIVIESEEREVVTQTHWIIRLRWVAIAGVLLTAGVSWGILEVVSGPSAVALLLISMVMAGYNALFATFPRREYVRVRAAFAQVFLDLAALTLMIYFTGGTENPFSSFYVFHVVIAGILLKKRETYAVTLAACGLYCGMALLQQTGMLPSYPLRYGPVTSDSAVLATGWLPIAGRLAGFTATAWCTAYFTTTIVEKLRKRGMEILEAEEVLSLEKAKTENIVSSVGAGLLILDTEDHVVWANEIARKWFGEEISGEACYGHLWQQDQQCETCPAHHTRERGAVVTCERSANVNGTQKFFVTSTSPIYGPNGEIEQILALIQDVTPVKEMESQLVRAGKILTVGELSAGIAHEISTPLAIVASSAEILSDHLQEHFSSEQVEESQLNKHLKKIEDNVYRCKDIIQTLLAFGRCDEDDFVEVDVADVLEEAISLVEGSSRARNRSVIKTSRYTSSILAYSKPRQVQHIFLNLLLNGLDAIEPGGEVRVSCEPYEGGVEITIEDTGQGLGPQAFEHLFEPFFTTKPIGKGTGLGLYLCKQIVDSLNGRISASSQPSAGAVFKVWLPSDSRLRESQSHRDCRVPLESEAVPSR